METELNIPAHLNACVSRCRLTLAWQLSSSAWTPASWESLSSTVCSCRARWRSVSSCHRCTSAPTTSRQLFSLQLL